MIRINLLPIRAAQKKAKLRSQLSVLIVCLVLAVVVCGALYMQQKMAIADIKQEIADIDKENKALKKKLGEVANFEKKKQEVEQKLQVLSDLKAAKSGPVHLLDELSNALPDKVWLTDFKEQNGVIEIKGFGDTEKTVAGFMNNLEKSPYYQNVELAVTEQASVSDMKMQKFTLRCSAERPSVAVKTSTN